MAVAAAAATACRLTLSQPALGLRLQRLRKQHEEGRRRDGEQQVARFLVTKLSWRGSYRRLLCITPTHVLTVRQPGTLV